MDTKLNFTDLCNFYAKAAGVPAAEAESFVHVFFEVIVEGLEKDGAVKINGLGTFKLVEVESRSSVNINTGERFEIDGHKRLTFVPADSLKEIINAPFAMFVPVEVEDDFDDDDDDEKDVASDEGTAEETNVTEEQEESVPDSVEEASMVASVQEGVVAAVEEVAEIPVVETEEPAQEPEELPAAEFENSAQEVTEECAPVAVEIEEDVQLEVVNEGGTFIAKVEIEEEMPGDAVAESVAPNINVGIEEEMPIDEADYAAEEVVTETIVEPAPAPEKVLVEEPHAEVEQGESVQEPQTEKAEVNNTEEKIVAPVVKEKITPIKEKSLYFDTLPRKKKENKLLKVAVVLAFVTLCAAVAFIGWWYYENNYSTDIPVKEQIAVVEKIESPVVEVVADTIVQPADSIVATEDSIVAEDSIAVEPVVVEKKDTVVEKPQIKEEKKPVERFRVVDALAVRELSTIFVADTTDYRIVGTMCTHKVKSEETLIRISLSHYGDKRLWPYIVKYNNMVRPNDLACDMVLKIPRLVPRK